MSAVQQQALRAWKGSGAKQKMNGTHLHSAHQTNTQAQGKPELLVTAHSAKPRPTAETKEAPQAKPQPTNATMERKLSHAQDVLGDGRLLLLQLAEQLDQLSPELEETAAKITRFKESRTRLQKDLDAARDHAQELDKQRARLQAEVKNARAEADRQSESSNLLQAELDATKPELEKLRHQTAELEQALLTVREESFLNEFRARHRKRERDDYRSYFHRAQYFIFKPTFIRKRKETAITQAAIIDRSGIFDKSWYAETCPDAKADPIRHYLWEGALEGLNPHPLFDTKWYVTTYRTARFSGKNPLIHYLTEGWKRGCSPHPWFDAKWYRRRYAEALKVDDEPLAHYLREGHLSIYQPHPQFDPVWYRKTYLDMADAVRNENPLLHFVRQGMPAGYRPNPTTKDKDSVLFTPPASGNTTSPAKAASSQDPLPALSALARQSIDAEQLISQLRKEIEDYEVALEARFHEIAFLTKRLTNVDQN